MKEIVSLVLASDPIDIVQFDLYIRSLIQVLLRLNEVTGSLNGSKPGLNGHKLIILLGLYHKASLLLFLNLRLLLLIAILIGVSLLSGSFILSQVLLVLFLLILSLMFTIKVCLPDDNCLVVSSNGE